MSMLLNSDVYIEYVNAKELCSKIYCFQKDLNLEMGTLKSIILIKTCHIQALTLVNDLGPSETLKMLLHLVL